MFLPRSRAFGTLTKLQMVEPNLKYNNNIICQTQFVKHKILFFFHNLFFLFHSLFFLFLTCMHPHGHAKSSPPLWVQRAHTLHHVETLWKYLTTLPGASPRTISEHMYNSPDTRLRKRTMNDAATTQHERIQKRRSHEKIMRNSVLYSSTSNSASPPKCGSESFSYMIK